MIDQLHNNNEKVNLINYPAVFKNLKVGKGEAVPNLNDAVVPAKLVSLLGSFIKPTVDVLGNIYASDSELYKHYKDADIW